MEFRIAPSFCRFQLGYLDLLPQTSELRDLIPQFEVDIANGKITARNQSAIDHQEPPFPTLDGEP